MAAELLQWLIPWEPSVTVAAATAISAVLYIRGSIISRPKLWQKFCFWLGLVLIYIVLHTQYDYYSEHEFFMHRMQHSVLHHLGPVLIVLSSPGVVLISGTPGKLKRITQQAGQWQPIMTLLYILNHPVIAPLIFCGLILFWLIPPIHFIAMLDWRLYRVMNWGMLVNGLMFWSVCLNKTSLSAITRIAMMLAIIPPQIVMGALIFFAPRELYPLYSLCGRAFGISALADQQLGGLILWIPAAMMSVLGIVIVIKREWLASRPA